MFNIMLMIRIQFLILIIISKIKSPYKEVFRHLLLKTVNKDLSMNHTNRNMTKVLLWKIRLIPRHVNT